MERNLFYEQLERESQPSPGYWEHVLELINDAMKKRDRSVSIYINPDNGMSISVYPWPDYEELYNMYQAGKISFGDFRSKAGLPMMKEEDFILSKTRFSIQKVEE